MGTIEHTIVVDSAESSSQIDQYLTGLGVTIVKERLPVGDYDLCGEVLIERKSVADFANSLMDGRMFSQASQMNASGRRCVMLIEGDLWAMQSGIRPEALAGALSALLLAFNISMVFSQNQVQSAMLIERMFKHMTEGLGYEVPLRVKKSKDPQVLSQYLVEGLPGVGVETARKLLKHFGSARAVFAATEAQLLEVDGMGKKGVQKVLEALDSPVGDFHSTKGPLVKRCVLPTEV